MRRKKRLQRGRPQGRSDGVLGSPHHGQNKIPRRPQSHNRGLLIGLEAIIVGLVGRWHELLLQFVEHNFSWITGCIVPGSGFGNLLARLKKLDRLPWHHG